MLELKRNFPSTKILLLGIFPEGSDDLALVRVDGKTGTVTVVRHSDTDVSGSAPPSTSVSEIRTAGQVVTLRAATATEFGGKAKALAAAGGTAIATGGRTS